MFDIATIWLKVNYFTLSHKEELKKWWMLLLIAFCVFTFVFATTNAVLYAVGFGSQHRMMQSMLQSPIDYRIIRQKSQPLDLEVLQTLAYPIGDSKYNILVLVKNLNNNWYIEPVTYKFKVGDGESKVFQDVVMPNSQKVLSYLGASSGIELNNSNVSLEISKASWKRIKNFDLKKAVNFSISNINHSFISDNSGATKSIIITADIKNNSFFGYWKTRFSVVAYGGDNIIGLDYVFFNQFKSGDIKRVFSQVDLSDNGVTKISIFPDFNYLDEDNIIRAGR